MTRGENYITKPATAAKVHIRVREKRGVTLQRRIKWRGKAFSRNIKLTPQTIHDVLR